MINVRLAFMGPIIKVLFLILVLNSCEIIDPTIAQDSFPDLIIEENDHPAIINMVKRAQQIANIEWVPKDTIPDRYGVYPKGIPIRGIPYSSVKELDKFVGHEVSFHTFMTAVNNPNSVLYTERVNESPYHGINCGAYYGTVCNMTVNYALGIDYPYITTQYSELDCFYKVEPELPTSVLEGDVLWSVGHVVLIIDIKRDSLSNIDNISILESGASTDIKRYNFNDFCERWFKDKWVAYRYKDLYKATSYLQIPFVAADGETIPYFNYNNDICTSRGDKACFREGESVEINILNPNYDKLVLYKDDVAIYEIMISNNNTVLLECLGYGMYKARLVSSYSKTEYTYFEIINTDVSLKPVGNKCEVLFNSKNAYPKYIKICTINGGQRELLVLTEDDLISKRKIIRTIKNDEYLKVYFQGKYGKITNLPIKLYQ